MFFCKLYLQICFFCYTDIGDYMKNKLITDIYNYIDYLNSQGLSVTVHGKYASGLLRHNIHSNSFCFLVKTDPQAWQKCIACQQRVLKEHKKEYIFGMCYAGMEEYVFFVNEKIFVSVSGYGINREKALPRIKRLCKESILHRDELLQLYDRSLKHYHADQEQLMILIKPLCHMLSLLDIWMANISETDSNSKAFDAIIAYIHANYIKGITIADIAYACGYSESSVSHIFKEHCGQSVKKYINSLRINQAKRLLATCNLSISQIASMCGFSNVNYFPTAFKKATSLPPTEFRIQVTKKTS